MAEALKFLGLPLDGTHHRGIDDARNIARIFIEMLRAGRKR
jgi:inhibitor of KinA sporulation pathway (predicted exonuclease)